MLCYIVIYVCINLIYYVVLVWWCQLMMLLLLMLFWQECVLLVFGIYKDRQNIYFCMFLICYFYYVCVMLLCYYFLVVKFSLLQKVFFIIFIYVRIGVWFIIRNIVLMILVFILYIDIIFFFWYWWYWYKKMFFFMDVLVWLFICLVYERSCFFWIN